MRNVIEGKQFDEERALYGIEDTEVRDCVFAGPKDGESVLKETKRIEVTNCSFSLRYPMWHVTDFLLKNSSMDELTRAAIWYGKHGKICHCRLEGIKVVRECSDIFLENCIIDSPEFGWKSQNIVLKDTQIQSEYLLLDSSNVRLTNVQMKGKYSFQYMEHLEIDQSVLDTKDAFWHSKNVTVRDSVVKGEYLGWFSENLTLVNCKIIGTQPLCYCKGLRLENCTMEETDLAFEYSETEADIQGHVVSVKNPKSGIITLDSVGEVIWEDAVMECTGKIVIRDAAK